LPGLASNQDPLNLSLLNWDYSCDQHLAIPDY
jgi:hypothetical protein